MALTLRATKGSRLTTAEMDANLSGLADLSLTSFTQDGAGAVARTVQAKERDGLDARDYGISPSASAAANSAALALLETYANSFGSRIVFPHGVIDYDTTWVWKNNVIRIGQGHSRAGVKGTYFNYTGASDAVQINNPINSSTAANLAARDFWIHSATRTAGKASIADVGSTFFSLRGIGVSGNDYGIILDQSELADIDECNIEVDAASSTAGIWLVNGAEHSVGASTEYTNRISIKRSQFNSGVASTFGILDDGGVAHVFEDNNYNGFDTHIRSCGGTGVSLRGGEFEGAAGANIIFSNLDRLGTGKGASTVVELGGSAIVVPTAGQSCVSIVSVADILFGKVYFGNTTAVKVANAANANTIVALGIYNAGGGATFDQKATRHFELDAGLSALTGAWNLTNNFRAAPMVSLNDDFLGDVLADQWGTQVGSDPQVVAPTINAAASGHVRMVTGDDAAASMAVNGVQLHSQLNWLASGGALSMEVKIKLGQGGTVANMAVFFGFTDQIAALEMPFTLAAGDALTSNASDAVGVLYDTAADTDNWWLVGVDTDIDATKQDSAVAPVANTFETWRIDVGTDGIATFYRNGAAIGTAMASSVTPSVALTPVIAAFSRTSTSKNIDVDYVSVQMAR